MKKFLKLFVLMSIVVSSNLVFGQQSNGDLVSDFGVNGPILSDKAGFDCPGNSVFSQTAVGSDNGYTSDQVIGYTVVQSFDGASGAFDDVTVWGIHLSVPSSRELTVEIYGPGSTPGALISTTTVVVDPIATGIQVIGYETYSYTIPLPVTNLPSGWISVYTTPGGAPTFYWLNTFAPSGPAYQNGVLLDEGVAFCLGDAPPPIIPISNWVFALIGIFAVTLVVFKFRK